jgi:hypothetical protein
MICEETQIRLTQAGFRLIRKDAAQGRFLIRYRDLDVLTPSKWRTLASYTSRTERDDAFDRLIRSDFWTIDIDDHNG